MSVERAIVRPRTSFNAAAAAEPVDYRLSPDIVAFGRAGEQVAVLDEPVSFDGRYLFTVIKEAGQVEHKVPPGFEKLAQAAADHQFSVSPHAKDKIAVMVARRDEIATDDKELFGEGWHAHNAFSFIGRTMLALYALIKLRNPGLFLSMLKASGKLSMNEYLYTDREPTLVQSARSAFNVAAKNLRGRVAAENTEGLPYFRPDENAVTFLPGVVYHRPPLQEEMKEESRGRERTFVDIMYLPVRAMESRIS